MKTLQMLTIITLFSTIYIVSISSAIAESWTEDYFSDFTDGRFDAGGNIFASHDGNLTLTGQQWDLNNDGFLDIIFSNHHDGAIFHLNSFIYWGSQSRFASGNRMELPTYGATGNSVADLNGDGFLDIVFSNNYNGTTHNTNSFIYWGSVTGFLSSNRTELPTHGARGNSVSDLNGDGFLDIVFSNLYDGTSVNTNSFIYWGAASGFSSSNRTELPTHGATSNSVSDLNGDGFLDIIFNNNGNDTTYNINSFIYWGSASGFLSSNRTELPTHSAQGSSVADLNGDGFLDIIFSNACNGTPASLPSPANLNINSFIYWGSTTGFSSSNRIELPTHSAQGSSVADLNGDGFLDIVFSNNKDGTTRNINSFIYWGSVTGFSSSNRTELPTHGATDNSVADLNGDGFLDIAFPNYFDDITRNIDSFIYWGSGSGFSSGNKTELTTHGAYSDTTKDLGDTYTRHPEFIYTSSDYDTVAISSFETISWTAQTPAGTSIQFQIRTADTQAALATTSWYGPTTTSDRYTDPGTTINPIHQGDRWVQYRLFFGTNYASTPILDSVTIVYSTVLNVPPEVSITSPSYGDTVYDKVQIRANVSDADNDGLTVSFLVDGVVVHTIPNVIPPQEVVYNWDTFPDYPDKDYIIAVLADDGIDTGIDSIDNVTVRNIVTVEGQLTAFVPGPTPDLPISDALLELMLGENVIYSITTDQNGMYQLHDVTPNLPGQKYQRRVIKDGVELKIFGGDRKVHYSPGVDVLDEVIKIKNYSVVANCPVDLHVYDAIGNHTGLLDGVSELGIPHSWYSGDTESEVIVILNPDYVYNLVIVGTGEGTFDLQVSNYITVNGEVVQGVPVTINVQDLPISMGDEISFTYDYADIEVEVNSLVVQGISVEDAVNQVIEPPTVLAITAPAVPAQVDTEIIANADFTPSNMGNTHTATWDWDDGSISPGTVTETDGSGTVSGSHTYTAAGVYTVTLTVMNNKGVSGQSTCQYVVIYDPDGGFVTGGGWVDSPEGAYTPDLSLTGKANFGFVSKYKKGADIPTGQTQFNFRVADLRFHSTEYQWLVVAGPHAKFKGSGTINDNGDYGFMLTATDGQVNGGGDVDKFRIKIWDSTTEEIIYDNQMGDDDDADATDEIEGGSIVIHKDSKAGPPLQIALPKSTGLDAAFPNPCNPEVWIPYRLSSPSEVSISIYDVRGRLVGIIDMGYRPAGFYDSKPKAAYWDGRNAFGEVVASGIYFYTFQAGDYTATRKLLITR